VINETVLIYDRGVYLYRAEEFAKVFKKVYYYMPNASAYPESTRDCIGADLDGVERVYDFDKYLKKCDWLYFPDCYDGEKQMALRAEGYPVFGEGHAGKLEMDKEFFYEVLEDVGLEVPYTYVADNFQEALKYLEDKENVWIKPADSFSRGDFETFHWVNKRQARRWVNEINYRLGIRTDDLRLLIQNGIKDCVLEPGYDGLSVNGQYIENSLCGFEDKDKSYIGKVLLQQPKIIQDVNDKMAPILKKMGCAGHWTTEIKITKNGKYFFLDPTLRNPEPPGAIFDCVYLNYPEACRDIAYGKLPKMRIRKKYCAQIMLQSPAHDSEQICVEFPKDLKPFIKLKNHTKTDDYYTIIPNGNGGFFGGCVGIGDTAKEAKENCKDVFKEIVAEGLEFDCSSFGRIEESIEAGKQFGINL